MASPLDFYLITDLHHYGEALGTSGTAYDRINAREQKCLAETGAIIDAYFDKLIADTDTKTVLIDGDLTNDGAMESHLDLLPRLQRLKDAGKDIYLITATHDYYVEGNNTGMAKKCVGDKTVPATNTSREELFDMYFEYGLNKALSIDRESHSYCVKLQDGYRLLCLNDDGDRVFCGYSENQLKWIEQQIDEAHTAGDYIFAMTHHPTLPPSAIYPLISARDMLGDWDKTTTFLADKGIEVMFTGHTHMQNIAKKVTAKDVWELFASHYEGLAYIGIHDKNNRSLSLAYTNIVALSISTIASILYEHNVIAVQLLKLCKHDVRFSAVIIDNYQLYFG